MLLNNSFSPEEGEAIDRIAKLSENRIRQAQRDQHPKQHGCVWAKFSVLDNLPPAIKVGVFQAPKTFECWIRFSNGAAQNDAKGDLVYGMAIKLMEVKGNKVLEDEVSAKTQDFVLATLPAFFVKTAQDYVALLEEQQRSNTLPAFAKFIFSHWNPFKWRWQEGKVLASMAWKKQFGKPVSPLEERYWSTTPYQLGNQAIKFLVRPDPNNRSGKKPGQSANYLREAMVEHLSQREACFDFYVQLQDQKNPDRTPVDDPTVQWETIEEYRVARITIPAQQFDSLEQMEFGEHLSFTPWHCLPEHQPLGSINRVRRETYQRTSAQRHKLNCVLRQEPTPSSFSASLLNPLVLPLREVVQRPLTVIVKIKPGQGKAVKALLRARITHDGKEANEIRELLEQSSLTHFARWVILEDRDQGLEPHLLFSSNHDGELENYVQDLIAVMGTKLDQLFSRCENYEPGSAFNAAKLKAFLRTHAFQKEIFPYVAHPGLSVLAIRHNFEIYEQLKQIFQPIADSPAVLSKLKELYDRIPHTTPRTGESGQLPEKRQGWQTWEQLKQWALKRALRSIGLNADAIPNPGKLAELNQGLNDKQKERLDKKYQKLQALEDQITQNQITVLTPLKTHQSFNLKESDWFYRQVTKFTLSGTIRFNASGLYKLKTIHFARWLVVDLETTHSKKYLGRKQSFLLFESNYDGAFDGYIDTFVEKVGGGMDFIWGVCSGFPESCVEDIEWFKYYIRKHQFPSQVFYSAYPEFSIGQVERDRKFSQHTAQWLDFIRDPENQKLLSNL